MSSRSGVTRRISLLIILALLVNGRLAGAPENDENDNSAVSTSSAVNREPATIRNLKESVTEEPVENPISGQFDVAKNIYYIPRATKSPCFILKFDKLDIEVDYYIKTYTGKTTKRGTSTTKFTAPLDKTIHGICGEKNTNSYLSLSWDRNEYSIELLTERTGNTSWNLNQVTFKYDTDDDVNFPNAYDLETDPVPEDYISSNTSTKIFANLKNIYQCEDLTMPLETRDIKGIVHPLKTTLKFTGFKLYPLDIPSLKDVDGMEGRDCRGPRGPTKSPYDSSIPIVVGVCLAVLILGVILGYFVRERLRKPQYSIME